MVIMDDNAKDTGEQRKRKTLTKWNFYLHLILLSTLCASLWIGEVSLIWMMKVVVIIQFLIWLPVDFPLGYSNKTSKAKTIWTLASLPIIGISYYLFFEIETVKAILVPMALLNILGLTIRSVSSDAAQVAKGQSAKQPSSRA